MSKKVNLKSRQHLLDFDYLDKLNDEEKDWLNRFVEEEIHANFNHGGEIINPPEARKRIYDANNARNRDLYLKAEVSGFLVYTGIQGQESYEEWRKEGGKLKSDVDLNEAENDTGTVHEFVPQIKEKKKK